MLDLLRVCMANWVRDLLEKMIYVLVLIDDNKIKVVRSERRKEVSEGDDLK
jgi:hypothetical protein